MRTAVSTSGGSGPRTVDETSARPTGARDGSTWLTTEVWATGPPRSASSSREAPVAGGSSVVWCTTVTGWKSGTRRPGSSSAAARASVATRTARQRTTPCSAVVTALVATEVTRTPVRTVPGGSRRASSSGSASAPPSGSPSPPRAKSRSARSATRLEVVRSGSQSSAASKGRRKPSIVRGGSPRPARARAADSSGRASSRSTGVPARRVSAAPRRAWSTAVPRGAPARVRGTGTGLPGTRAATTGRRGAGTERGALARARTAWSAPLAPRADVGAPARWWRPSLCSSTPGAKGSSARPSSPGARRSSGHAVDSTCPILSSRKPSTFSVAILPPTAWAASRTVVVTPALVSRCAATSPAIPAPTTTTSAWYAGSSTCPSSRLRGRWRRHAPNRLEGYPSSTRG